MSFVTVRCMFPTGQYDASDSDDAGCAPEWPPTPFRVFAALVAGAARLEHIGAREAFVAARRALEELEGVHPTVDAPAAHTRFRGVNGFVPINDERHDLDSFAGKKPKAAAPSTLLPVGGEVVLWFPHPASREMAGHLEPAARHVPYLGRPTSPVVMTVAAHETLPVVPPDMERWTPQTRNARVAVRLRSAPPGTLRALDHRFMRYLAAGETKQVPLTVPLIDYAVTETLVARRLDRSSPGMAAYRPTPKPMRGYWINDVLLRLTEGIPAGVVAVPITATLGEHADGHLVGVLAAGVTPTSANALSDQGWEIYDDWSQMPSVNRRRTYASCCGRATTWTTVTPMLVDAVDPVASAIAQAPAPLPAPERHAVALSVTPRAGAIPVPLTPIGTDRFAHATYTFDHVMQGPIAVDAASGRGVLWPLDHAGSPL